MKLKRYVAIISMLILLFSFCAAIAAGAPGSAGDPVVSLRYIQETFIPKVMNLLQTKVDGAYAGKEAAAAAKVTAAVRDAESNLALNAQKLQDRITYSVYMKMLDDGFYMQSDGYSALTLKKGESVVVGAYSSFTVCEGAALISGGASTRVTNVTAGGLAGTNTAAIKNSRYVVAEDGIISVKAVSDKVKILVEGKYQTVPAYIPQYTDMAFVLKEIDLFRGSNLGFELEREPTRLEALILFLRLIGEEQQALAGTGTHPFTDVPKWGNGASDKYVAYAYQKGYTKGISATKFGSSNTAVVEQYLTFVLRALGYKDGTDFDWSRSADKAQEIGILRAGDKERILRRGFYRDMVVQISYYSLQANQKGTSTPLIQSLVQKGLLTEEKARAVVGAFPRP